MDLETVLAALVCNLLILLLLKLFESRTIQIVVHSCPSYVDVDSEDEGIPSRVDNQDVDNSVSGCFGSGGLEGSVNSEASGKEEEVKGPSGETPQ